MISIKNDFLYYIGIDEAGRGPLAGPLAVGGVCATKRILKEPFFKVIRDSKKLSAQKRREIFHVIKNETNKGNILYTYSFICPKYIDMFGLKKSTYIGIYRCLSRVCKLPKNTLILLDGGIYAPKKYKFQKTIIHGDEKESLIALASIVAKVKRDEHMERLSLKYPEYLFEQHKGYGTKLHLKRIKTYGTTNLHRLSFLH